MENKYQRALDKLTVSDYEHDNSSYGAYLANKADNETIQELVDRATPKKEVLVENGYPYYKCPTCDKETGYEDEVHFCRYCGQAIYWEEK